mmetsp:Transcript_39612/g.82914  ORF Transcript_39612/g.82914 Transcript_39612/m.82914 type:complete len:172 (-) Transcript_39612:91-606(-)
MLGVWDLAPERLENPECKRRCDEPLDASESLLLSDFNVAVVTRDRADCPPSDPTFSIPVFGIIKLREFKILEATFPSCACNGTAFAIACPRELVLISIGKPTFPTFARNLFEASGVESLFLSCDTSCCSRCSVMIFFEWLSFASTGFALNQSGRSSANLFPVIASRWNNEL